MDAVSSAHSIYSININEHTSKSLGVSISHVGSNNYVVFDVAIGSIGEKMGISVGDTLLSINDVVIQQILHPPSRIASILSEHKTPFLAQFMKRTAFDIDHDRRAMSFSTMSTESEDEVPTPSTDVDYDSMQSLAVSPKSYTDSSANKLSELAAYSPLTVTQTSADRESSPNTLTISDDTQISNAFTFDAHCHDHPETHSEYEMIGNLKKVELLHRFVSHSEDKMAAETPRNVYFDALKVFPSPSIVDLAAISSLSSGKTSNGTGFVSSHHSLHSLPITPQDGDQKGMSPLDGGIGGIMNIRGDHSIANQNRICMMSSKGLSLGYHEWTITILKSDVDLQEIGVISNSDLHGVDMMAARGVRDTKSMLARAVFGNELCTASLFRASYNDLGNKGVFKDLSKQYNRGWCTNDQITVCLDFGKNAIKFLWNGQKVKSMMRIQKGLTYYPVIAFSGNCQYHVH